MQLLMVLEVPQHYILMIQSEKSNIHVLILITFSKKLRLNSLYYHFLIMSKKSRSRNPDKDVYIDIIKNLSLVSEYLNNIKIRILIACIVLHLKSPVTVV